MSNMSYCRFQNTFHDLQECAQYLNDELSEDEERYRNKLIQVCLYIIENAPEGTI